MQQKTFDMSTPSSITPNEWNKLYNNAIASYSSSVWQLADVVALGKDKWGRSNISDMTGLDQSKIRWLSAISEVPTREAKLLPEHHSEVVNVKRSKYWLQQALKNKWKPTELRAAIRKAQATVEPPHTKRVNSGEAAKALLILESQLSRCDDTQRTQILSRMSDVLSKQE